MVMATTAHNSGCRELSKTLFYSSPYRQLDLRHEKPNKKALKERCLQDSSNVFPSVHHELDPGGRPLSPFALLRFPWLCRHVSEDSGQRRMSTLKSNCATLNISMVWHVEKASSNGRGEQVAGGSGLFDTKKPSNVGNELLQTLKEGHFLFAVHGWRCAAGGEVVKCVCEPLIDHSIPLTGEKSLHQLRVLRLQQTSHILYDHLK